MGDEKMQVDDIAQIDQDAPHGPKDNAHNDQDAPMGQTTFKLGLSEPSLVL